MTTHANVREDRSTDILDPVIVLGAPRSGVRLVSALLAAQPGLLSGPQLPFFVTTARNWHEIATKLGANHARHYGLEPQALRGAFESALLSVYATRAAEKPTARPLIHSLLAGATLGIFAELFPAAKLLYVVRDVRGCVSSLLTQDWRDPRTGVQFAYTCDPIAAADYWVSFNMLAHADLVRLRATGRLRIVRYEELCTEPDRTLTNMAGFLGVEGIAKRVSRDAIETVSSADAAIYPPPMPGRLVPASVSAWRKALTPVQQEAILARAGGINAAFGYEPSGALLR
jgi:hypothetical protein